MIRVMQTDESIILFQIQRGIRIAVRVAVVLVAIAMSIVFISALVRSLHATFVAYVLVSLMTFTLLTLWSAATLSI